jgi:hypothetical protein
VIDHAVRSTAIIQQLYKPPIRLTGGSVDQRIGHTVAFANRGYRTRLAVAILPPAPGGGNG